MMDAINLRSALSEHRKWMLRGRLRVSTDAIAMTSDSGWSLNGKLVAQFGIGTGRLSIALQRPGFTNSDLV
jgi:hypothetical protein